jgi:hypothetical protein
MVKKFLLATAYILGFMALWSIILGVGIKIINADQNQGPALVFALIASALVIITFVPFLNFAAKKSFYFPGTGQSVSEAELRQTILSINNFDVPVSVVEKKKQIIITWRYVDAKWWEIIAKAGLTQIYELHVKFNEAKKEVTLIDVQKNVDWRLGTGQTKVSGGYFRGVEMGYEVGAQWGIKENFQLGKIYSFKFSPSEIKNPVLNTILKNGWAVRMGMW